MNRRTFLGAFTALTAGAAVCPLEIVRTVGELPKTWPVDPHWDRSPDWVTIERTGPLQYRLTLDTDRAPAGTHRIRIPGTRGQVLAEHFNLTIGEPLPGRRFLTGRLERA